MHSSRAIARKLIRVDEGSETKNFLCQTTKYLFPDPSITLARSLHCERVTQFSQCPLNEQSRSDDRDLSTRE